MPRDEAIRILPSACPHDCPSTCALDVEILDAKTIGRVSGSRRNDYTDGVICAKVARYAERVHHPDRLTEPLRRVGEKGVGRAAFEPVSWDEALDVVADRLTEIAEKHGRETVYPYFYAGTMGLVQRDGIERLRHAMGYTRQFSTICTNLADAGWVAGVGQKRGVDAREIQHAELIVVWGGNPVSTQVNVMTHIAKAKKARGAKLVVVDPYRTGTAAQADMHLAVRPGTDGALACAVMHILFRDDLADRAYLAKHTDHTEALEEHLRLRGPQWASAITGLAVEEIEAFAKLYGATRKSYIRVGYGFSRSRNGAAQVHAVSCLPSVTGAWTQEGGGALYGQSDLYLHIDQTVIKGLDVLDRSTRSLDQSRIGPCLVGDKADLGDGPPVMALFIQNTNPMMVAPELAQVHRGFGREDLFVCVHEQFMTETAAMADIVLPATTFLEHDDFYKGSGHTYLQVTKAVIEPLAQARPNHDVVCALAKRLGAEHPGFAMTAWELMDDCLKTSGLPDAETIYEAGGYDLCPPFETAHFLDRFPTATGRFRFSPDWASLGPVPDGLPAFPDHFEAIDAATPDRPFRLVTAPARSYLNSSFTETPTSIKREGRPSAMIHPEDCAELGLDEGDRVRMGNDKGSVVVHVKPFDGLQRGVVVVESIWPNKAFEEGIGINLLVSAEAGRPNGGAVFHDTAVWLRAA